MSRCTVPCYFSASSEVAVSTGRYGYPVRCGDAEFRTAGTILRTEPDLLLDSVVATADRDGQSLPLCSITDESGLRDFYSRLGLVWQGDERAEYVRALARLSAAQGKPGNHGQPHLTD